jgi:two-component system, NarL family, invasion response regulator UvrY
MLNLLIVDDHSIIRKGLRQILLEKYPSSSIDEAGNAEEVMRKLHSSEYDIVISDLSMPGRSGLDVVEYIRQHFPKTPVLILSIHPEEQYAIRALRAGAAGYLSKDSATEELVLAVQKVLQGRKYISASLAERMASRIDVHMEVDKPVHEALSNRELEVFKSIAGGKSVSDIAEQLSLSITTVSTYRARIMMKMNMKSNADMTRYCMEFKLI